MAKCPTCGQDMPKQTHSEAIDLLEYLNELTGKNFRPVPANLRLINARITEYGHEDLAKMVAMMAKKWQGSDMESYLRPATLFNASKCAQYMGNLDG